MMDHYDSALALEAWKQAVNTGIVDEDKLRPEIARSWKRCLECGLDPWSMTIPDQDEELLKKTQEKYAAVIQTVNPIMQYLLAVFNSNVSIANMQSYVFHLITPLSNYSRTLGTYTTEDTCGNGNITIAIHENKPVRVDGYEHFRAYAQTYSGVACPMHSLFGEDFVLCMNNPFKPFPPNALDTCITAARMAEKLAKSRREAFTHLSSASFFDPIIKSVSSAVIVTDPQGNILTANGAAKALLPDYDKLSYAEASLSKYLKSKSDLDYLMSDVFEHQREVVFKGTRRSGAVSMFTTRTRTIKLMNGAEHHIIVLENAGDNHEDMQETPLQEIQLPNYIGNSPEWNKVDTLVRSVARYNANVMITGDTGTGKEVVAQALHRLSGRKGEFVAINCGGLPRELLSSELFGYESGAFTGARSTGSVGKFEYANGGTLFLDEIGDMPVDMQVSLLRVIQEQCITRIGANKSIPINVRIIAATNQDMKKLISLGRFRSDLWYRLSVIEIHMPLLRDRRGDVPLLAEYFNTILAKKLNTTAYPLSHEVEALLDAYPWPGNVRELRNAMEKALIMANGAPISADNFPEIAAQALNTPVESDVVADSPAPEYDEHPKHLREKKEREKIINILEEEGGNISRSAKRLGMSRNTLYRKIEKMNIQIKVKANDK